MNEAKLYITFHGEELTAKVRIYPGSPGDRETPPDPTEIELLNLTRKDGSAYPLPWQPLEEDLLYAKLYTAWEEE